MRVRECLKNRDGESVTMCVCVRVRERERGHALHLSACVLGTTEKKSWVVGVRVCVHQRACMHVFVR